MPIAFITGITGQDGGYLAEQLLSDGYEVHGLIRDDDPAVAELLKRTPGVVVHSGDLLAAEAVRALIHEIEPDEIFSLGGISSVAFSWEQPELTAQVSGMAVATLLESAWSLQERLGRPVRLLQASSAEIFGSPAQSPQTELTRIAPNSPYGAAKAFGHLAVGVYRSRGLFATSAILFNHESPRRPETFVTRKITATVARIARGQADKLVLGNLDARRDWGWAPDYVDAMVRAIRADDADDFVIATGISHTVEEFVAAAFAAAGIAEWRQLVRTDPRFVRPVEAVEQLGDPTRAFERLGWRPSLGFENIVAAMVGHDLAE